VGIKFLLALAITLSLTGLCFAGQLAAGLAGDYYAQGLEFEATGTISEAKAFYQKALLLDPDIKVKNRIKERIARIDTLLNSPGREAPGAKPAIARRAVLGSAPYSGPAFKADNPDGAQGNLSPVLEDASVPQKKAERAEFLSYYSGREPFLQDCYTGICRKIIFNNFGISYAQDKAYSRAKGMFEESLRIDQYFKPASFNLVLVKDTEQAEAGG
jgi:tetratricopeptide (TPR) repeat protein